MREERESEEREFGGEKGGLAVEWLKESDGRGRRRWRFKGEGAALGSGSAAVGLPERAAGNSSVCIVGVSRNPVDSISEVCLRDNSSGTGNEGLYK